MSRVLVNARTCGIGNAVMLTPLIELAAKSSGAPVDVLVSTCPAREVFSNSPFIRQTIPYDRTARFAFVRQYRRRYEIILSPDYGGITAILRLLAPRELHTVAPLRLNGEPSGVFRDFSWLGDSVYQTRDDEHETLVHARVMNHELSAGHIPNPKLFVTAEETSRARMMLSAVLPFGRVQLVAVHIGSGEQIWKRLPEEKFVSILRELLQKSQSTHIVLVGSASERESMQCVRQATEASRVHIFQASLRDTFAAISLATAFLGNDSGLGHVAAALGLNTVIVFGPTNELRTVPVGSVSHVKTAVSCRPCYNVQGSPYRPDRCPFRLRCLTQIEDAEVVRKVLAGLVDESHA